MDPTAFPPKMRVFEMEVCPACDGSGEGVADTTCTACDGLGIVSPERAVRIKAPSRSDHDEPAIVVKFSTLAGGVFIEVSGADEYRPQDRCFRFDANGNAEWASYGDLASNNPAPRWFGHVFKKKDFLFA